MSSNPKRQSVVKSTPTNIDKNTVGYLGSGKLKRLKSSAG